MHLRLQEVTATSNVKTANLQNFKEYEKIKKTTPTKDHKNLLVDDLKDMEI